jgi:phage N-6-adenine-methyltransferase
MTAEITTGRVNTARNTETVTKSKKSMINRGMYSHASEEWETPRDFFDALNADFHFTLDLCATPANAKCGRYFTKEDDALSQQWVGVCWMNPPYGREIGRWLKKAYESAPYGATVVCLLPARTDTAWWHDYVLPYATAIQFVRGRLRFSGKDPAPFPSVLIFFGCFPEYTLTAGTGYSAGFSPTETGGKHLRTGFVKYSTPARATFSTTCTPERGLWAGAGINISSRCEEKQRD